ncbi:thymic stromal lymphopoietin [Marmota flaviventris]|uniref:thymic stromal lymphopoietin n=1 Tax=Marmota flaviventris TaxID=93162 RepID=UPI003A85BA06
MSVIKTILTFPDVLLFVLPAFFRKILILHLVGLVLTYNFTNCDYKKIRQAYKSIIFCALKEYMNGTESTSFDQIESCYNPVSRTISASGFLPEKTPGVPGREYLAECRSPGQWRSSTLFFFSFFFLSGVFSLVPNVAACEQSDCLIKIEHHTFNPTSDCLSLSESPFALKTNTTLVLQCSGYSGIQKNNTQEMKQEGVNSNCLNQTSQILGWWRRFSRLLGK